MCCIIVQSQQYCSCTCMVFHCVLLWFLGFKLSTKPSVCIICIYYRRQCWCYFGDITVKCILYWKYIHGLRYNKLQYHNVNIISCLRFYIWIACSKSKFQACIIYKEVHWRLLPYALRVRVRVRVSNCLICQDKAITISLVNTSHEEYFRWRLKFLEIYTVPVLQSESIFCLLLRLSSANHRPDYWSNLPCNWPSTAWAYSEQDT